MHRAGHRQAPRGLGCQWGVQWHHGWATGGCFTHAGHPGGCPTKAARRGWGGCLSLPLPLFAIYMKRGAMMVDPHDQGRGGGGKPANGMMSREGEGGGGP